MENSTSATSSSTSSSTSIPNSLRLLNKSSHKISKQFIPKPQIPTSTATSVTSIGTSTGIITSNNANTNNTTTTPPQQPQPPVYNINKNDFREVVQKLTGSPAFNLTAPSLISSPPPSLSPPPPPPPPPPPSSTQRPTVSRLHRIRPPPLAELAQRPQQPPFPAVRPPMSPLPPLPAVNAAVESPITAYMRRLRGEPPPASPLAFGCFPSPGTVAALSPTRLFPTSPGPFASPQ